MILAEETGMHLFYKDIVILSEKPCELHRNTDNRIHNSNGAAIKWKDGYEIHALNGIRMPKEIAELRPSDLTKEIILKQENADWRRELVRKLSGQELLEKLNPTVLDEKYGYSLLIIDLGDERQRPFLKMINPSIDTIHIEGVEPRCRTVEEAINFRNSLASFSLPQTLDGFNIFQSNSNYDQQGDCLFFFEPLPSMAVKCSHKIAGEGLIRHMINNGDVYELNGVRYVVAGSECTITHPEHKATSLKEGSYRVGKIMEYDHWLEESREVID